MWCCIRNWFIHSFSCTYVCLRWNRRKILCESHISSIFRYCHEIYFSEKGMRPAYAIYIYIQCVCVCLHNRGLLSRFQSPNGLTDFPFAKLNFNLYIDLNNSTLKSRIVAIVSSSKMRTEVVPHERFYNTSGWIYRLKIAKMRWYGSQSWN